VTLIVILLILLIGVVCLGNSYYLAHRVECLARSKRYYLAHRVECLARSKRYYLAHRAKMLALSKRWRAAHHSEFRIYKKRWREANLALHRFRSIGYFRKWRDSHNFKNRCIQSARDRFPLGGCCEFCGSTVDLMRFLVEYKIPVDFVLTVCRECRGFARKSLAVSEGSDSDQSEPNGI